MSENGNKVMLKGNYLKVYDKQRRLLMNVKRSNNQLYKIILESGSSECLMTKAEKSTWLWHSRIGHVNFQAMKLMSEQNMAYGLSQSSNPKECVLGACWQNKRRKLSRVKLGIVRKMFLNQFMGIYVVLCHQLHQVETGISYL